jgi:Uma2 family endonuclease
MTIATQPIALEEFLKLPETKPASDYIEGEIFRKPMPKSKHSRLQLRICNAINAVAESQKIAYAFPELCCTFGGRSLLPDVAVHLWNRIQFDCNGGLEDDVRVSPDWTIEILLPEQSPNRVTGNILHCIQHGTKLGWLIDPGDRSILVFFANQPPKLYTGSDLVPVPDGIFLNLTSDLVFSWLKMAKLT